jgi:hypothetical protein
MTNNGLKPAMELCESAHANRPSSSVFRQFSVVAFIASFGIATALGFLKPYTNWDMVAYVGSVIAWQEKEPAGIHQRTLQDVEQGVSIQWRKEIAEVNARSKDSGDFVRNLPFYWNKPAYIAGLWLVRATGLTHTYAAATWTVAAFSFACFGILLLFWRPEHFDRTVWLFLLAAFCWFGNHPVSSLARFSSPDSMSMVPMMGALLCLFRWNRPKIGMAWMLSAILVRPDAVIFIVMAAGVFFLINKTYAPLNRTQCIILAILALALYFLVQSLSGGYGYEKFFYYTYVNGIPNPAEINVHLNLSDYWRALAVGLGNINSDSRLLPFLVLSVVTVFCYFRRVSRRSIYPWLLALAWSHYAIRFLLFPSWQEYRYYAINYLLVLIACSEMIALALSPQNRPLPFRAATVRERTCK